MNFQVEQPPRNQPPQNQPPRTQPSEPSRCKPALTFCGIRDSKYPDRRAMGFPFDRPLRDGVDTFRQFIGNNTNMAMTRVTVIHSQEVRAGNLIADTVIPARDIINAIPDQVTLNPSQQGASANGNPPDQVVLG